MTNGKEMASAGKFSGRRMATKKAPIVSPAPQIKLRRDSRFCPSASKFRDANQNPGNGVPKKAATVI
jgi:hypothetical protein